MTIGSCRNPRAVEGEGQARRARRSGMNINECPTLPTALTGRMAASGRSATYAPYGPEFNCIAILGGIGALPTRSLSLR